MSSTLDSSVRLSKPFSSDTDQDKQDLLEEVDLYREKLESQWGDLKKDASQYGKQALIIGGVITATYIVLQMLLPDTEKGEEPVTVKPVEKKKKSNGKKKSNFAVGEAVQSLAWTLAIGWARQKLKNYIADDQKPHESSEL